MTRQEEVKGRALLTNEKCREMREVNESLIKMVLRKEMK